MTRFTAVILMLGLLSGCATSGSGWPSFAKRDTDSRQIRANRKKLKDPSKLDLVGVYESYAEAEEAWRDKAQRTVDDAEMRYVVVHLHRLLEPENLRRKK